jgi:hypothetical protein
MLWCSRVVIGDDMHIVDDIMAATACVTSTKGTDASRLESRDLIIGANFRYGA